MTPDTEPLPDDINALRAALVAERTARHEAEAHAAGAEVISKRPASTAVSAC